MQTFEILIMRRMFTSSLLPLICLGNIVWIRPLATGTSADVLMWDGYGPSGT